MLRWLLALAIFAAPVKVPGVRIFNNGKLLRAKSAVLRLSGAFTCDEGSSSTNCVCPSVGMLVTGTATFLLTSQATITFDAPWVTDSTGIACGAQGPVPARFSYTLAPGSGFTVLVDSGVPWVGSLPVACIGAVP